MPTKGLTKQALAIPIDSLPARVKTAGSAGALSLVREPSWLGKPTVYGPCGCLLMSIGAITIHPKKDGHLTSAKLLIHRKSETLSRIRSPVWHSLSLERSQLRLTAKKPVKTPSKTTEQPVLLQLLYLETYQF